MADSENPAAANSGASKGPINTQYGPDTTPPNNNRRDMYDNIPAELKVLRQWVCWRLWKVRGQAKLTKVPFNPLTDKHASSADANTWLDFATCVHAARHDTREDKPGVHVKAWDGIGFVLTERDPFCFIDFDLPKDANGQPVYDPAVIARHTEWIRTLNSYTEVSPGGGVHVIVKANVPQGRRRDFVEVYFSGRFMTMTGNVWMPQ